ASVPFALLSTPILTEPGVPRVAIMSGGGLGGSIPAVSTDRTAMLEKALDFLASRGRRRVAIITTPPVEQPFFDEFHRG
ncbi:hypothetical protein, partial [Salmonella sp. SAL4356]|uniref:hypothetical protein n=1 Tax=Salmonella sp. SAL4356 TaxID=3159877 RepID=UPI00397B9F54